MAGSEGVKGTVWEGGSLDELLALLGEGSWSARIEAFGKLGGSLGVIDVVAGGVAEARAGELRGDEARISLRDLPEVELRVELRLPHPTLGGLDPPGDREGSIANRPVASLMRYCEEYVLSCALLLTRDDEVARIVYRRGELVATLVDGSDAPHRLPDVMAWRSGTFVIDVEGPTLLKKAAATPKRPGVSEAPTTLFGYPNPSLAAAALAPSRATPASSPAASVAATAPAAAATSAPPARKTEKIAPEPALRATPRVPVATLEPPADPASSRPTPRAPMPAVADGAPRPTPRPGSSAGLRALPTPRPQPTPLTPANTGASDPAHPAHADRPTPPAHPVVPSRPRPAPEPPVELPPTGLLAQPVIVHVLLGITLGVGIVIAYWAYLRAGGQPF